MKVASLTGAQRRDVTFVCCVMIAAELCLSVPVLLHWARGVPPSYPGQYLSQLLSTTSGVGLMSALLVAFSARYQTPRGRLTYWLLLGVSVLALVASVVTD